VLVAPGAREVPRDLRLVLAAPLVAQRRELVRVTLAADDRPKDVEAGCSGQVGDGSMDLHVHLVEGLLHPLHRARSLDDEVAQLSVDRPHARDLFGWAKRRS